MFLTLVKFLEAPGGFCLCWSSSLGFSISHPASVSVCTESWHLCWYRPGSSSVSHLEDGRRAEPGSQRDWEWLKGAGGASPFVLLLADWWLVQWMQCGLYRRYSLPYLPCLMQVVATPKDSHQHRFWTSRWAALWQSRLPVCLAVLEHWNRSRHCPTVCYQRGKTLFSLQHHSVSEVELGLFSYVFQAI